jgi:hypothetical protein
MSLLRSIAGGLRSLFRKERATEDLDEQLRGFLEMAAEEKMKEGMNRKEALRAVRLERGNLEVTKEVVRSAGWESFLETCWRDMRFGLRTLRKSPGFTAVAILTLALGIGANTAIFDLFHAVMLKSLPVTNPGELFRLGNDDNCCVVSGLQENFSIFSYALYQELRDHTPEFSELAAFQAETERFSLRRAGASSAPEPYVAEFVSGNYFYMFGVTAVVGRVFAGIDDTPSAPLTAILSYRAWRDHFGVDRSVINSTVILNGLPLTVLGVTPPGFYGDTLRSDPPDF